ncbi:MAG: putative toxin-antitoxin system toxin component, PIN family [Thermodesulfobacteriota bacterium]
MTSRSRIVLDTGVIVSAILLPHSVPRQALDLAFRGGTVLASTATLEEFDQVVRRPKFSHYVSKEQCLRFLAAFVRDSSFVEVNEIVTECRDPKDNKFLELALSGEATFIVSGDRDLLILHPFRGIPVLTPKEFVSLP